MAFKFSVLSLEKTKDYETAINVNEQKTMTRKINKQSEQQEKFRKSAKKCSGKEIKQFRRCMSKELKK